MTFITSLFSVASWATWVFLPLNAIFLTFDGIVYSLVAYSYELFTLMSQMNFNVIYAWVSPLIDRIQALIMVLIMFKLGISLLQYMLNPDKFTEKKVGGPALIKNIAISAALLVGYSFVFSVLNELSLLIIGVPDGYEFTVLNDLAEVTNDGNDPGLISRFVFGDSSETDDFGKFLSVSTLQIFLHGKDNTTSDVEKVYANVMKKGDEGSDFNMMEIVTVVSNIDRDVEYKWPLLSTAMGLYLIYSIVKIAIEVGVRMFKLVILQILAPVAIISIIDNGFDSKIWKSFIDTYWKTFIDIFIRVASMFIVTAFISKFWTDKTQLFPEVDSVTQGLVLIIIIVAGYRLAGMLPKFIDSVFGSKLSENNSKGFGKFAAAVGGAAIGLGSGFAAGVGSRAGFFGTIGNTIAGGIKGGQAGYKGNGVADFFKNVDANGKANRDRATNIARQGGGIGYAFQKGESFLGIPQGQANRAQQIADTSKALDNMMSARSAVLANQVDNDGQKFGDNADSYANMKLNYDSKVAKSKAALEAARSALQANPNSAAAQAAYASAQTNLVSDIDTARDEYTKEYNNALWTNSAVNNDKAVKEATRVYDGRSTASSSTFAAEAKSGGNAGAKVKDAKKSLGKEKAKLDNRGASRRANKQGIFGGK